MSNKITAEGVMAVIGAGKEDEGCLKFTYGSESKLESGFTSEVSHFAFVTPEPVLPRRTTSRSPALGRLVARTLVARRLVQRLATSRAANKLRLVLSNSNIFDVLPR